jgi:hypothetical protein
MDPTVHGYSLTARKPAAGVGATWGFAGTPPSRVASTLAYVSAASDLSEVRKPPFFEPGCDQLQGQTIWIADAHRGNGKRFVGRGEEKLTAFLELEAAIRGSRCQSSASNGNDLALSRCQRFD